MLEIVNEDVHERVQLKQRRPVDITPATHIDACDDLVSRGEAKAGEFYIHVLVVHGETGV